MRNTRKILVALLVLMTLMVSVFAVTASAAAGQTWTVAGESGLCGSNWNTGDKNNDMTYDEATDSYVKVFLNVKAGTYQFKCAKDHAWTTAYPSSNKSVTVEKDGSTVTVTLKGTSVSVTVEAPACDHNYEVTSETVTCTEAGTRTWKCSVCENSYTEDLAALGHYYTNGDCIRCDATTEVIRVYVDNAANWADVYCYTWDTNPYVSWPGEKMAKDEDTGYYYYDIPKNFVNVIFNNGGSAQSADLEAPTADAVVYNNSTKAWGELPAPECEHNYEKVVGWHPQMVAADCVTVGVDVYICSLCEAVDLRETSTDPEAHAWWGEEKVVTEANCATQTDGLKKVACANGCGEIKEQEIYYSEAHDWDIQKNVQATCTVDGEYYAVCEICNEVESYPRPAEGHYNYFLTCGQSGTCMAEECGVEFTMEHAWYVSCTEPAYCMNWCGTEGAAAPGHNFVDGVCTVCEEEDPDYVEPENKVTYVFESKDLVAFDGDKQKGEELKVGTDDFFTLIFASNSKTQGDKNPAFEDGYTSAQRLSFNGNTKVDGGFLTRTIKFVTNGPATITIWWECGDNGRNIEIYTWDGEANAPTAILSSSTETVKTGFYITTFEIEAAGTYYLGHTAGTSYFYKVALTQDAPVHEHAWSDATCTEPQKCECGETQGEALGHTYSYNLCTVCYVANPHFIYNLTTVGENKLVCNQYHLVDTDGHGFPYQFTFLTILEDGIYAFTTTDMLGITVFTIPVTDDNINTDFALNGPGWEEYDIDGIVELKAGTYYIGYIFIAGEGEYTLNVALHEHSYTEGKCVCGAEDPEYVPPHEHNFVEGKCECGESDPNYVAPEQPKDETPEQPKDEASELTLIQKIIKAITDFFANISNWFKGFIGGLKK